MFKCSVFHRVESCRDDVLSVCAHFIEACATQHFRVLCNRYKAHRAFTIGRDSFEKNVGVGGDGDSRAGVFQQVSMTIGDVFKFLCSTQLVLWVMTLSVEEDQFYGLILDGVRSHQFSMRTVSVYQERCEEFAIRARNIVGDGKYLTSNMFRVLVPVQFFLPSL